MIKEIVKEIKNLGIEAQETTVTKGGISVEGIILGSGNIRPTIYPDVEHGTPKEIAEKVVERYKKSAESTPVIDESLFSDWSKAKDNLFLSIRPVVNDDTVVISYLDLEVYVRLVFPNDNGMASCKVNENLLKRWGVTKNELFLCAIEQTKPKYQIQSMVDALSGLEPESILDAKTFDKEMYVITTTEKINGASVLFCNDIIVSLANKLNSDLFIIPSSIHEIIVVPCKENGMSELTQMIREVNAEVVDPTEQLSDHAYLYSRDLATITY